MITNRCSYEQLSKVCYDYLTERFYGDAEEVRLALETAERIIPNTLNVYFGTQYESVYENVVDESEE